jgi:hypothetical protein
MIPSVTSLLHSLISLTIKLKVFQLFHKILSFSFFLFFILCGVSIKPKALYMLTFTLPVSYAPSPQSCPLLPLWHCFLPLSPLLSPLQSQWPLDILLNSTQAPAYSLCTGCSSQWVGFTQLSMFSSFPVILISAQMSPTLCKISSPCLLPLFLYSSFQFLLITFRNNIYELIYEYNICLLPLEYEL